MSFDDSFDAQHRVAGREKYEVTVKLTIWASGEDASERKAEKIIQAARVALVEENEDILDDYEIEDTSPAAL
tara:strand:- start:5010 stop:5225 length:216 start_codon:yes stop_codon:yes gene_type:complete